MHRLLSLSSDNWLIKEKGFCFFKQQHYESLFTLGNGYLGIRGSLEENPLESYRGTYIAGIYNQSESFVKELVKAPGWIDFSIWYGEEKFAVDTCKVLFHERILDMKKGVLHRQTRLKTPLGKVLTLKTKRLVFSHEVRGGILEIQLIPENFSGEIRIISGLNGDVTNLGYFNEERVKHLHLNQMHHEEGCNAKYIYLEMETRDQGIKIALAADTRLQTEVKNAIQVYRIYGEKIAQEICFHCEKKKGYSLEKWSATLTSREGYVRQLKSATIECLHDLIYEGRDYHFRKHLETREQEWERADIKIRGDDKAQQSLRLNLYHLIIAKPHHDATISIGAKFLTGEGYKGHVFWDTECFILPFYIYTFPDCAKSLLMYRYYTLEGALKNAKERGYWGAKFAWESADDGKETTPDTYLREDGTIDKVFAAEEEHHIVADVVWGLYKYIEATKDYDFLYHYGAEIIFQTARFWISRVEKRRARYEIRKIIGPDEFHEHVDNNAFTNYLAMWNLYYAVSLYEKMGRIVPKQRERLVEKIKLQKKEIEMMKKVAKHLYFPFHAKQGLIEQFEGYFTLKDEKIKKKDKHGLPKYPKEVAKVGIRRTQLIKQADVVLLMYLFLDRFSDKVKKKNYEYYEQRTMHKSSLSLCSYALMGLEVEDHKRAYEYFMKTSTFDLVNAAKKTHLGIHAAATGGSWMTVVQGFGGMKIRKGMLTITPWLPKKWRSLSFQYAWRKNRLKIVINKEVVSIEMIEGEDKKLVISVEKNLVTLQKGKTVTVKRNHQQNL